MSDQQHPAPVYDKMIRRTENSPDPLVPEPGPRTPARERRKRAAA